MIKTTVMAVSECVSMLTEQQMCLAWLLPTKMQKNPFFCFCVCVLYTEIGLIKVAIVFNWLKISDFMFTNNKTISVGFFKGGKCGKLHECLKHCCGALEQQGCCDLLSPKGHGQQQGHFTRRKSPHAESSFQVSRAKNWFSMFISERCNLIQSRTSLD